MFMRECVEPLVPVCYFTTLLIFYTLTQSMFGVGGAQDTSCVPHCWFFVTKPRPHCCIKSDRQGSQFLKIYHTYKQLLQNGSALINTP